jgi:hypothetical protein
LTALPIAVKKLALEINLRKASIAAAIQGQPETSATDLPLRRGTNESGNVVTENAFSGDWNSS